MHKKEREEREIILLLKAIPNNIEKKLLIDFLKGHKTPTMLNKYAKDHYFGIFNHLTYKHINTIVSKTEDLSLILIDKDIKLTAYGIKCKEKEQILPKEKPKNKQTTITNEEQLQIEEYKQFLSGLNNEQKKAVICNKPRIVCVAGAGSGKTTILTKRIIHLIKNKNVDPKRILAITFTKKAKENMQEKLENAEILGVHTHTFNSFGESMLRKNHFKLYKGEVEIINYKQKIEAISSALKLLKLDQDQILIKYFSNDTRNRSKQEKFYQFVNDCFSIRDYFNNNCEEIKPFYKGITDDIELAQTIFTISKYIEGFIKKNNLRDFSDQLKECINLFENHPSSIPKYEHILIDEYQDINTVQKVMIDKIKTNNLFCVGDPRQSIYGWRGSKVEYILNFKDAEYIYLTKNYRCAKEIIELANKTIEPMQLPDLESEHKDIGKITFNRYQNAKEEASIIAKKIKTSDYKPRDIYVIARTNTQLENLIPELKKQNIPFTIKKEETTAQNGLTIATVHCVKGLEAKEVYIIGTTSRMFPCLKPDHKILEYIKDYYNKKEEELRLLYVAITRAEENLHISYYGNTPTKFLEGLIQKTPKITQATTNNATMITTQEKLNLLSTQLSAKYKIPKFMILSNEEIQKIAKSQPKTHEDLKIILNPTKSNRYGNDILKAINDS